jgi:hypothetical protein
MKTSKLSYFDHKTSNDKEILIITNKSSGRNMEPQNKGNIKSFATDSNYKSIS